jgi:hypothetical protein
MGLPLLSIILTSYQLPTVVSHLGAQQFRSLVASFDILIATFTSNAVVLGSLLQDRGYKKEKYKRYQPDLAYDKRPDTARIWGSDEDLMQPTRGGVDKEDTIITLQDLNNYGKETRPDVPPKAKFAEIRVNSTWEVQVVKDGQ